ncbi:MAG: Crp/Fnr family transcriptional regulator, partial [Algoriella sp.]
MMDKSIINNYFKSLFPIENDVVEKITTSFCQFELDKNKILIDQNTISTKTYFLEKGYVRSYTLNEDNEEVTTNIFYA